MNVKIMSRQDLMERAEKAFPERTAIISITDSGSEEVVLGNQPQRLLRLTFDDVSDEIFEQCLGRKPNVREMHQLAARFHMLTNAQSRQIADFVLALGEEDTLICQCEYGQSRSAGVAAAVLEYHYGGGIRIFAHPRYYPNKYVFGKVLQALRLQGNR